MCSVSWLIDKDGYQIFFNRDEQKNRALALPPQQLTLDQVDVLIPIDPVGKGSWISVNEFGLSLCLLNNYQGKTPSGELISRGLLLKNLSVAASVEELERAFKRLSLRQFAPFTLLAFDSDLTLENPNVMAFEWNGEDFHQQVTEAPHFSSGVELEQVVAYRHQAYLTHQHELLDFHRHHHIEHSHFSVCMHRHDAQTVSFTHVQVTANKQQMSYVAGSPCMALSAAALTKNCYQILKREALVS
ncbi:NRDE family protein [Marinomonas transparens]|uniref:NRDE family protein n=1 Tax=Marinomonas transparens TaxID=2795388 RepID=A0A934JQ77_9GAMM|nr:NRDE family protein [Marinomonas transparens]MBJ7536226.1 NRDE family protein [Marinomonas transparens]